MSRVLVDWVIRNVGKHLFHEFSSGCDKRRIGIGDVVDLMTGGF